jgi:hypothetical protein
MLADSRKGPIVSGRFHYYNGIVKLQENDADDIGVFEELFAEAGLAWKDCSTDEAVATLGRDYAMGYLDIDEKGAILRWKEPVPSPQVLAQAEVAFRRWADEHGYDPWFSEPD